MILIAVGFVILGLFAGDAQAMRDWLTIAWLALIVHHIAAFRRERWGR